MKLKLIVYLLLLGLLLWALSIVGSNGKRNMGNIPYDDDTRIVRL